MNQFWLGLIATTVFTNNSVPLRCYQGYILACEVLICDRNPTGLRCLFLTVWVNEARLSQEIHFGIEKASCGELRCSIFVVQKMSQEVASGCHFCLPFSHQGRKLYFYVVTWNVKTYFSHPLKCRMSQKWLKWCSAPHPPPPPLNSTWLFGLRNFSCQSLRWWWVGGCLAPDPPPTTIPKLNLLYI